MEDGKGWRGEVPAQCKLNEIEESVILWRLGGLSHFLVLIGGYNHSYIIGGLRLRNYCVVAGNPKFSSRFSFLCVFLRRSFKQHLEQSLRL